MKIFPNTLEELHFQSVGTREQSDKILRILENDDDTGRFRESLTTLEMQSCKLNENDLKRLIFDIRPKYPKLHTMMSVTTASVAFWVLKTK